MSAASVAPPPMRINRVKLRLYFARAFAAAVVRLASFREAALPHRGSCSRCRRAGNRACAVAAADIWLASPAEPRGKRRLRRRAHDAVSAGVFTRTASDCWTTARVPSGSRKYCADTDRCALDAVLLLSRVTRLGGR